MAAQGARLACRIIVVRAPVAKGGGTCIMIRTPDQRVRVFVSSTLEELAAERQRVTAAITALRPSPGRGSFGRGGRVPAVGGQAAADLYEERHRGGSRG